MAQRAHQTVDQGGLEANRDLAMAIIDRPIPIKGIILVRVTVQQMEAQIEHQADHLLRTTLEIENLHKRVQTKPLLIIEEETILLTAIKATAEEKIIQIDLMGTTDHVMHDHRAHKEIQEVENLAVPD